MTRIAGLIVITATLAIARPLAQGRDAIAPPASAPQGVSAVPNQTDNPLTKDIRSVFDRIMANLLEAARSMPATAYGFKPADGTRTFGELVAHIATVQSSLCADINGSKTRPAAPSSGKEAVVASLESSVAQCHISFAELSAQNLEITVQSPIGRVTHLVALVFIITHASEEYGQLSVYLRLNHVNPPTSDTADGGAAGKS